MKISDKQKALFQHAAWSAGATATAAALGWLGAHQADLVSKRYEFIVSLALIPGLEYARKWFKSRDKGVAVVTPAPVVVAPPVVAAPDPTQLPDTSPPVVDAAPAGEVAPGEAPPAV